MKTQILIIIILLLSAAVLGQTWTSQTSGTENTLEDIDCVDRNNCWAVGHSGTIRHTTDGGLTWTSQNSGTDFALWAVDFVDLNNGWIAAQNNATGLILHTTNGGATWASQGTAPVRLWTVGFADLNNGWIMGDFGYILHTTNGGATWNTQTPVTDDVWDVHPVSSTNVWAVAYDGYVLHTTNGGANWTASSSGTSQDLYGVSFFDANNGWVVGNTGTIRRTTNGGGTWTGQSCPVNTMLRKIKFVDASTGWIVGYDGVILGTTNGGTTWTTQTSGTSQDLFGVSFVNSTNGWVVGASGKILRYGTGNQPPVAYIDDIHPNPAQLGQTVYFSGHGTDTDGMISGYNWRYDLDPQPLSTQESFSASLLPVGTYTIYFKVRDDDGSWSPEVTTSLTVRTAQTNQPPVAEANGPYSGDVGDAISFSASGSYDLDGTITGYRWDWTDDGTWDTDWLSSATTTHAYQIAYFGPVRLEVKDNQEATAADVSIVSVSPTHRPVADAGGPYSGIIGQPIAFDASQSYDSGNDITGYRWDWTNDGTWDTDWLSNPVISHIYSTEFHGQVRLEVKDSQEATSAPVGFATVDVYDLASGLVGYWTFDHSDLGYDETQNSSGQVYGQPSVLRGVSGNCLDLDGEDDCIQTSRNMWQLNVPHSFCAWVKPHSVVSFDPQFIIGNSWLCMYSMPQGSEIESHNFWWLSSSPFMYYDQPAAKTRVLGISRCVGGPNNGRVCDPDISCAGGTCTDNFPPSWTFVCGTWDGQNTLKLFVNGELKSTVVNPAIPSSMYNCFNIGAIIPGSSDRAFRGQIDEVRLFDRVLTADEIQLVYTYPDTDAPPEAIIESIVPDAAKTSEDISFKGRAYDRDGAIRQYLWSSDIDGELSTAATFSTRLSEGIHHIYFQAQDNHDKWSPPDVLRVVVVNVHDGYMFRPPFAEAEVVQPIREYHQFGTHWGYAEADIVDGAYGVMHQSILNDQGKANAGHRIEFDLLHGSKVQVDAELISTGGKYGIAPIGVRLQSTAWVLKWWDYSDGSGWILRNPYADYIDPLFDWDVAIDVANMVWAMIGFMLPDEYEWLDILDIISNLHDAHDAQNPYADASRAFSTGDSKLIHISRTFYANEGHHAIEFYTEAFSWARGIATAQISRVGILKYISVKTISSGDPALASELIVTAMCPIHLNIIDPTGRLITADTSQVPDARYYIGDLNGDSKKDVQVYVPHALEGPYQVFVIRDSMAADTETFSLYTENDGERHDLAINVPISQIPNEPYIVVPQGSMTIGTGYAELLSAGPPDWAYRLHHSSGSVDRLVFTNICPGTSGRVSGLASNNWLMMPNGDGNNGDSIVFLASIPLTSGTIDTFWLSHPYCADMIRWCVGDTCNQVDGPLPVELLNFEAIPGDQEIELRWATASEIDNDHFELLRDGRLITRIPGAGTSTTAHNYSYDDNDLANDVTYTYTLVGVDLNGNRDQLAQTSATPRGNEVIVTEYALYPCYPNPFNATTNITFDLLENGEVKLGVYNLMGQKVAVVVNEELLAGRYTVHFNAENLPSGLYIYRIQANTFSATKKMLLVK